MKKILLDIDGVIADMKPFLQDKLHKIAYERGIKIQCNNIYYRLEEYIGLELRDIFFRELYDEYVKTGKMYEHADEVTKILSNNYEIHIVTARGTLDTKVFDQDQINKAEQYREWTKNWLDEHGVVYNKLVFESDKIDYIIKNKIDLAVEDSLDTLLRIKNETEAMPLCFSQTYNTKAYFMGLDVVYSQYDMLAKIESALGNENN